MMNPQTFIKPLHQEIYNQIHTIFEDFPWFDELISTQLHQAIIDTDDTVEIDIKTTRKIVDRYYKISLFQNEQQKLLLSQIQLIFKTTYVLLYSKLPLSQSLLYNTTEELFNDYPEFMILEDQNELERLLQFRNYMKIALQIIPASFNKQLLMKIAARLEGSPHRDYITGGGQRPEVTRRCLIYEREGGVTKKVRPRTNTTKKTVRRRSREEDNENLKKSISEISTKPSSSKRRFSNYFMMKDVKKIRISQEELQQLSQQPPDPFNFNNSASSHTCSNPNISPISTTSSILMVKEEFRLLSPPYILEHHLRELHGENTEDSFTAALAAIEDPDTSKQFSSDDLDLLDLE
eukprot:gene6319-6801_t